MFMELYIKMLTAIGRFIGPTLIRYTNWYIDRQWKKSGRQMIEDVRIVSSVSFTKRLTKLFYNNPSYRYKYDNNHNHGFYLIFPSMEPAIVVNFVPDYNNSVHLAIIRHEYGHHVTRAELTEDSTILDWEHMADMYAIQFVEKETYKEIIRKTTLDVFPEEYLLEDQIKRMEALDL